MATVIILSAGRLVTHCTALLYCVARCEVATQNCQDQYLHNSSVDDCDDPADTAATCSIVLSNAGWWRGEVCSSTAAHGHKCEGHTCHWTYPLSSVYIYWYLLIYTELTTRHTHRSLWSARTIDSCIKAKPQLWVCTCTLRNKIYLEDIKTLIITSLSPMDPLKFLESISHYRSFHRTEKFIDDFIHGHLQLITPYCAWMRTKASNFGQVYFMWKKYF